MSDLYSVLKQSIIERGLHSPRDRAEVYAQARDAMTRQLWAFDPPLDEDEIDARIDAFNVAVTRIEDDLQQIFATDQADDDAWPDMGSGPEPAYVSLEGRSREIEAVLREETEPGQSARAEPISAPLAAEYDARDPVLYDSTTLDDDTPSYAASELYSDEIDEPDAEAIDSMRGPGRHETDWPPDGYDEEDEPLASDDSYAGQPHVSRRVARRDRKQIRFLLIIIAALLLLLVGIGAYILAPLIVQSAPGDAIVESAAPAAESNVQAAPSDPAPAVAETFALFDGSDPTVFLADSDNPIRFDSDAIGSFARIATSTSSAGARAAIGPGLAQRLAGRNIRVMMDSRSAPENGAANFRFAYQSGLAVSHWQSASLSSDYADTSLFWRPPTLRTSRSNDYLIIEPGIPGDGTAVDIRAITIEVLDE